MRSVDESGSGPDTGTSRCTTTKREDRGTKRSQPPRGYKCSPLFWSPAPSCPELSPTLGPSQRRRRRKPCVVTTLQNRTGRGWAGSLGSSTCRQVSFQRAEESEVDWVRDPPDYTPAARIGWATHVGMQVRRPAIGRRVQHFVEICASDWASHPELCARSGNRPPIR